MLLGSSPAIEKLALFWHGHFATSARKVDDAKLMLRQIELFRQKGAGPFLDLLGGVARDPAMLVWLDGNSNRRGKPNENFGRELFELFALGIGNYTEADIKEAARAFTGWHVRDGEYWFNERRTTRARRPSSGAPGSGGATTSLKMSAEHEACARFISGKLFEFYVHPAPGPELRRELAALFRSTGGRTGEFLAKLLGSRVFHSKKARRALVSSPADYTVGSLRTIGARASAAKALAKSMASMGLELLAPPSVKGWAGGEAWLSSTTLLSRFGFSMGVGGESDFGGVQRREDTVEGHAIRRYWKGHYFRQFGDAAIEALLNRGELAPSVSLQAYGGAIAEVPDGDTAFSHRDTMFEFVAAARWTDPDEDAARIAASRSYAAQLDQFASGAYVNVLDDEGRSGVRRAYAPRTWRGSRTSRTPTTPTTSSTSTTTSARRVSRIALPADLRHRQGWAGPRRVLPAPGSTVRPRFSARSPSSGRQPRA